jgi:hypothetical protein
LGGSGSSTITLTANSGVALGNYSFTLSGNSGSISHSTIVPVEINDSVGDWTGYVTQSTQNVQPGGTATYTIVAQPVGGFTGNISYSVSGLPAGATANFVPPVISGGSGSTTLSIVTSGVTPQPSTSTITVTGINGVLTHSIPVYLGVSASTGDFAGSIAIVSGSVPSSGGSGSYTVTLSPVNGGAGDVALSVSGLPPGATASFTLGTISASSGTSTLNINVPSGTPSGTYAIFVTSTAAGVIHQGGTTLTVTN